MSDLDEHEKIVLRDYLADQWSRFVAHCESMGADPGKIYVALGGEPE